LIDAWELAQSEKKRALEEAEKRESQSKKRTQNTIIAENIIGIEGIQRDIKTDEFIWVLKLKDGTKGYLKGEEVATLYPLLFIQYVEQNLKTRKNK